MGFACIISDFFVFKSSHDSVSHVARRVFVALYLHSDHALFVLLCFVQLEWWILCGALKFLAQRVAITMPARRTSRGYNHYYNISFRCYFIIIFATASLEY